MALTNKDCQPVLNLASRMEGRHSLSLDDIKVIAASQKIDMDARNHLGWSPLMIACANDDKEMVKFLLDHGADPNARCTKNGNTPMHFASLNKSCGCLFGKNCNYDACHKNSKIDIRLAILRLLISHGATLQRNSHGLNPPCLAALHKLTGIVKFFAQRSERISGLQLSLAEKVEAYEILGVSLGLGTDLDEYNFDGIESPFLYMCRAVSLCEESGITLCRDHEQSEIAAHFSLFKTKECKTRNDLEDIKGNPFAVKIQCFLIADRVLPEKLKRRFLIPGLLSLGFDGITCAFEKSKERLVKGSQIIREAIQWELQSKLKLGRVLRELFLHMEFRLMECIQLTNDAVKECCELMDLCLQVFSKVPKRRLHNCSTTLMINLDQLLTALSDDCKLQEMFESLLQFSERMVDVVRSRCGSYTPSVTHLILEDIAIAGLLSDSPKWIKLKENRVKHVISRMLQCEDASQVSILGNSMLHSLLSDINSSKDLQFLKDTALILIRNGCSIEARNDDGKTAEEIMRDKDFFNPDAPENEEFMTLISPPTTVLSLEEIAARTILRHKILHDGIVPRHLSAIVRGDLEPDSELFPPYDPNESSSDSELDLY